MSEKHNKIKRYIGIKEVNAKPMNLHDYNKFRGFSVTADDETKEGYIVEYLNGGDANTAEYAGYVSWSPKHVFDEAYKEVEGMTFDIGIANRLLDLGHKIARLGWNGKNMYVVKKDGYQDGVPANKSHADKHGCEIGDTVIYDPYLEMRTATGSFVPWVISNTDFFATDYIIVQ